MSRVDDLLEAAESVSTYFLRYTRARTEAADLPVFIFEGKDDPKYYTPRITYRFGGNWRPLSVEGKANVLSLREEIRANRIYSSDLNAFFVDRDFDEETSSAIDLYVTPCYSVENFYTHPDVIRQLLYSSCSLSMRLPEQDELVRFLVNQYEKFRNQYISDKSVKRVNLAFLFVRKILKDQKISLDTLFKISHNMSSEYKCVIEKKKGFQEIKFGNLNYDSRKKLRKNKFAIEIKSGESKAFRGKQEIAFVRDFIFSIRAEGKMLNKVAFDKYNVRLLFKNPSIGNDVLDDLSSVANTPNCLANFIDNFKMQELRVRNLG